ncbi:hypothetical protein [Streptomyces sp. DSM 41634]|uniref:hypothetical protein n=1 Tax=Streptomyces sp. DSM 41634 TaxID=3448656 RepID=UPI0028842FFB|nr:hypothetical protein [Streptomyces sp. DSM 41633]
MRRLVKILRENDDGSTAATAVRVGLRTVPAGGYGLADMAERAEALGGSFTAGPTGWLAKAALPL